MGARTHLLDRTGLLRIALAVCGLLSSVEAQVRVRINVPDAKPLVYRDPEGKVAGFGAEIFEEIARREGWTLAWVDCTWSEALRLLEEGELDLVFPMMPNADRRDRFDFTEQSLFTTWGRVFAQPGSGIESVFDLSGRNIGVVEDDFFALEIRNMLDKFHIDSREPFPYPDKREALLAVEEGEVDAVALEGFVTLSIIDEYDVEMTPIVFTPSAPHVVARRGDSRFLGRFDHWIARWKEDEGSVYYTSYERWFGFTEKLSDEGFLALMLAVGAIIIISVLLFVLWVRVRESREEVETKSRDILENMPVMLNAIGEDGRFVVWNKECERVAGYSAREMIGNANALEMLYPDPEYRAKMLAEAEELDFDYHNWERRYTARDGSIKVLSTSSISRRFPVQGWKAWGIAVDITERKEAEEALRAEKERLRLITDSLPVLIVFVDRDERFGFCNATCEDWFGLTPDEVIGKHVSEVLGEETWEETRKWALDALRGDQVAFETQVPAPGGEVRDIGAIYVPSKEDGEVQGFYALLADISPRKRSERQRRRLEEQLRQSQKMEAVGELASGVAHDFRNLLTVISAHTDRIKSEATNTRVLDSVRMMEKAVDQASVVTRSLLTFSRKLSTVKVPLDLCAAIDDTTQMITRTMPATIEVHVDDDLDPAPWIEADPTQLQQVLLNLALNARDAMPDGGDLTIAVEVETPGEVRLCVRDTGCGMAPEIVPRIFEPFFTTKEVERGTGLGLATVHGIVEDHGGRIEVASKVGAGTSFTITFPTTTPVPAAERWTAASTSPAGRGETILLAEDNPQIRQIVAATLMEFGYQVIQAADGEELARCYQEHREKLRLIVTDVDLPRRSGLELVRELRTRGSTVPIVLISTNTGTIDPDLLDSLTVLLPKPFQMSELASVVHGLLAQDPTRRKAE